MEKIKNAALVGVSWGVGIGVCFFMAALLIGILEFSGVASWEGQRELDCYKKLDKAQCQILYPSNSSQ
jgi:hypothetical protein